MAKTLSFGNAGKPLAQHKPAIKQVAKKAAKHVAKKAAKKAAKKGAKHEGPLHGKDELRAFGHLGRLAVLRRLEGDKRLAGLAARLISAAEEAEGPDNAETMAELLKAAEHVVFAGAQADIENPMSMHPALEDRIAREYDKKKERAEADAPEDEEIAEVQAELLELADRAYEQAKYTQALELMRAAEVLATVAAVE